MGLEDAEAAGGYARQLTDEEQQKQRELLAEEIGKMDAVISTAAVPGRRAPLLVTEQAVKNMSPGSVIVDLAAETGGNCELTEAGADGREGGRDDRRTAEPALDDARPRVEPLRAQHPVAARADDARRAS